jgi:hypothetical protein
MYAMATQNQIATNNQAICLQLEYTEGLWGDQIDIDWIPAKFDLSCSTYPTTPNIHRAAFLCKLNILEDYKQHILGVRLILVQFL